MNAFTVGTKVVRVKNHKAVTYGRIGKNVYSTPASISREFGEVVEVHENGRVRVKWTARQWHLVGDEGPIKPLGRNLRTWNDPKTLQAVV